MEKKTKKNRVLLTWIVLLIGLFCSKRGEAISTVSELQAALGGSNYTTVNGSTVILRENVTIYSTLEFTSGTMTLIIPKNYSLTIDRRGSTEEAKGIYVNGSNANLTVTGGGTIIIKARNGNDGKSGNVAWEATDGDNGYSARGIVLQNGNISLYSVVVHAIPGAGGKGGSYWAFGTHYKSDGKPGDSWVVDADNSNNLGDIVPYGAYFSDPANVNYTEEDGGIQQQNATVALSNYTTIFNINGTQHSTKSYTLDGGFSYPNYEVDKGYTLSDWTTTTNNVTYVNSIPVLTDRSASGTITFNATVSQKQYSIKYVLQGGTNAKSNPDKYSIKTNNGNPFTLHAPTWKGYDFIAWRNNNKTVTIITYDDVEQQSVNNIYTLTAQWQLHNYNVTFDVNVNGKRNSTFTINDTSFPEPDADQIPEGKDFDGWYIEGTNTKVEFPLKELKDLKLKAHWKDKTYYAFFYDGNVEINKEPFTVTSGLTSFKKPNFKEGYIFEYWMDAPTNGNKVTSIPKNTAGDKKLYAFWTPIEYTLIYDLKGGSYTGDKTVTYTYNERAILLTGEQVSYSGYKLLGWKLNGKSITEAPISGGTESNGGRKMSFTVFADWDLIDYDIVFNENGGTPVDDRKYNMQEGISENDMPKTKRDGYNFLGWYTDQDKKVTSIAPGNGKLILMAKWELKVYNIIYHLSGGTNPNDAHSTYTYEDNIDLLPPTKEHYDFGGWFTEKELVNAVSVIERTSTGDKTFYAKWSPKTYTLTFNPTGGRISQTEQKYIYGEVAEFARKPYKDHYEFDGWYYNEACTKAYGSKVVAGNSGDHTLYAKWKLEDYKIVLDSYNGEFPTGTNIPTTYTYESTIEKLPEPRRQGFTFAGWYADDLLTKPVSSPVIKKGESGDKKFYATWDRGYQVIFTQPSYGKITVTWNGSAVPAGTMIGKGESLTVTAEATDANYELKQLLINGKPFTSSPQLVMMPKEDLKITAEFTEASTPAASAPELIITPSGVDKFPKGEDVKVQLKKTDESTTLYYSLDGSAEKKYEREFAIGSAQDTVLLKAIARKPGFRDGVTSRYIIFDNGKITLTFDLPLGVKAVNPSGGEVVTATTTGGSFEFELKVDKEYYTNLDSMVVSANDSIIKPGSAGLYTLTNCSSDVTVTVSGLKAKVCTVTLQQTENGNISFTDGAEETTMEVDYGASVSITAKADEDFKFLQWSTGSQNNPLKLTVDKDTTISARFISDYKAYAITLPQLEGVTVKPFSGYSTEVKKDGTFKFYLKLADGYREENLVVRANGEELEKNKGGYAIYYINKNISISVEGIVREPIDLKVPENVQAKVVETMTDPSGERVYGETMILLYAEAPAGKTFSKWTDGKTDNPRLATAQDAAQLHPLFVDKDDENYAKVTLHQSPGAAITTVNANIDAVKKDEMVQLKVVLLPAYSQSDVILTVDDQVIKPEISLRAASETKTYVFFVPVKKNAITVKVSGIKRNSYHVSVAQTNGGTVSATPGGEITHGQTVRLKAQPEPGMLFIKWWDGNTLNPYPYVVTSDTEVKAYFVGTESTVDNETIRNDENVRITVGGGTLSILTAEASMVYIWDHKGALFHAQKVSAGRYAFDLPAGIYLIKVGDLGVKKVMVGGPSSI